jgi:SOS-response transcriptional repressor LexA
MIVYEATAKKFINDVDSNQIIPEIEKAFQRKLGRGIPPAEISAYANSLPHMERVVRRSKVSEDCGILIEYKIPLTNFRIDFVIAGTDINGNKNFVIVELKQWQKAVVADGDGLVESYTGNAQRVVTHPSYQALHYKDFISDFNEVIYGGSVKAYSCAYLHNYPIKNPEPLLDDRYKEIIQGSPIYFRDDQSKLEDYIAKYVKYGKGMDILYEINNGKIQPSKKLIDHVASMFEGNKNYILLDEQKVVFETARSIANKKNKSVIIIKGGPGTGKSVIAVNLVSALLGDNLNTIFVAPNSSFRDVIVKKLTQENPIQRIRNIFKGSSKFYDSNENEFDVLIVDEAHRLKKRGAFMYQGQNQVDDVIKSSNTSIFFIDDDQAVRPEDIGSVRELKKIAGLHNAKIYEMELTAQFRCAGAEGYINWINDVLQIKETANYDGWDKKSFDFRIFDNPNDMRELVKEKSKQGNSARILAGYAWNWTSADEGNADGEIEDIVIPEYDFSMPWNSRKIGTTYAIDERGIEQVGCIHTTQGLEFDYIGVIVGNDLVFNKENKTFSTDHKKYKDKTGKKGMQDKPEELNKLVRNVYKVLMTRGMKGCYLYFTDKETGKYFKNRMNLNTDLVNKESTSIQKEITPKIIKSPYMGEMVKLPLFDSAGCGELMLADSTVQEMIDVPATYISKGSKYFVLRTTGDSMNKAGINDGDLVLCVKKYQPETGEIVVALIGDDATIKEFHTKDEQIILKPKSNNTAHNDLIFTDADEVKIQGIFKKNLSEM